MSTKVNSHSSHLFLGIRTSNGTVGTVGQELGNKSENTMGSRNKNKSNRGSESESESEEWEWEGERDGERYK